MSGIIHACAPLTPALAAPSTASTAETTARSAERRRWLGVGLLSWLSESLPAAAEVEAEIQALAHRHDGRPMKGAAGELMQAGLAPRQADLLRACVRSLNGA